RSQAGALVGQLAGRGIFEIEIGVGRVGPARGLAGEVKRVADGKDAEALFGGEVAVVGGEVFIHLQRGEAVVAFKERVVLAVGPSLVDDDLGGGGVFADGGDELVEMGLEGLALEALVADLLEGDDVPFGGLERLDEGDAALVAGLGIVEAVVGAAFFVAGAGLGEVAGVAFERAAADAGAAEEEVLAAGLGDLGQEAGGVVGEAVADGKELE